MRRKIWLIISFLLAGGPVLAASIDAQTINEAQWSDKKLTQEAVSPEIVKLQAWLDRAHFSPGEIDGKTGENLEKAIASYAAAQGKSAGPSDELWQTLSERFKADPIIIEYKISESDVKGPFVEKIPAKMEDMRDLPALSYTSPQEKIAEQFHMSPELLLSLNPNQKFDKPGETVMVTSVSGPNLQEKAQSIEVDKSKQTLKVFDKSKALLAVYPVTAGSSEKPAPDGTLKVTSVSKNPTYRYNPDYAFKGVKSKEAFTIKPGPNNPVGLVWIGLNKEGYGLHGTPEPSKVSKSESHGCIRLTNWDALQLASAVTKGVQVVFTGDEKERPKNSPRNGKRHRHR
jgi:lipoprotein-anchoring transpeptidase ErfK/SrfK